MTEREIYHPFPTCQAQFHARNSPQVGDMEGGSQSFVWQVYGGKRMGKSGKSPIYLALVVSTVLV